jgi:predicted DNA-binding transcriptional regulator
VHGTAAIVVELPIIYIYSLTIKRDIFKELKKDIFKELKKIFLRS